MKLFFLLTAQVAICISLQAQQSLSDDTTKKLAAIADTTFTKVEIESSFPGGSAGWVRFLNANLVYPGKAIRKKIQGDVVVQFIVSRDGSLSDIEAISGPELLREAAVKVIEMSPKWVPASINGRKVKSYKKQPIMFRLE